MNEIWKNVVGYEGYYQINNFGIIKSLKRVCNSKNNKNRIVPEKYYLLG